MKIQLIENANRRNHLKSLSEQLETATEAFLAVAFLRVSGLNRLMPALRQACSQGTVQILVGTDFGLTEPRALKQLMELAKEVGRKRLSVSLVMPRASASAIFHPKYYRVTTGKRQWIVSGSANLTSGGLRDNAELSFAVSLPATTSFYKQCRSYERRLLRTEKHVPLSPASLEAYEERRPSSRQHHDFSIADREVLYKALERFRAQNGKKGANKKSKNYKTYRSSIIRLSKTGSSREFERLYTSLVGRGGGFHSSGLDRNKGPAIKNYRRTSRHIRFLIDHLAESPDDLFRLHKKRLKKKPIKGFGTNTVTEILNALAPKRFAVVNRSSIDAMSQLSLDLPAPINFKPDDYGIFCRLADNLCAECSLKDLSQLDFFFHTAFDWKD